MRRRIFEFFNRGAGRKVSSRLVDLHFRIWKLRHSGATFADYYAGSIAARLNRGGTHKTLGRMRFLSGSLVSPPVARDPRSHQTSGIHLFELCVRCGLTPWDTCIDYGCGSLRLGVHLIAHLEAEKYWGFDVVSDFYQAGKSLLPPGLLERKRPELHTIEPHKLEMARQAQPDFVFSFAVVKHIPPAELGAYFSNVVTLMAPGSKAVITFIEAEHTCRTGAKIWSYSQHEIEATVQRQGAGLDCVFRPFQRGGANRALPRTSVLLIRRREPVAGHRADPGRDPHRQRDA